MEFHPEKCQVVKISNKLKLINSDYQLHNQILKETNNAKYLGVTIDNKLLWRDQHNAVCKKANGTLAFLKRNISGCPQHVKAKCYKALVKPILNYGSSVWDPHYQKHIEEIEKIQKNAARFATKNYNFTTGNTKINMDKLKWIPLEEQRARNKVTTLYKAINGHLVLPMEQYNMKNSNTRSGVQNFTLPSSSINSHLHSYFPSSFRLWNKLPNETKLSVDTEEFKNKLGLTILKSTY